MRKPCGEFYRTGAVATHDPARADDLGLEWQMPIRADELAGNKLRDFGGVYCPTLKGRGNGGWGHRYRGIHRGHDMGITKNRLGGLKIPVHAVADGIFDGQREYTHAERLPKDCRPVVLYHFSRNDTQGTYTSIYCHVDANPDLKVGQWVEAGETIATLEDPEGRWGAHVHLEIYTRPVFQSKDSTKLSRCGCKSDAECDAITKKTGEIPRGCGVFEDDLHILEPVLFIRETNNNR